MNYILRITKTEANPNFKEELETYERGNRNYNRMDQQPMPEIVKNILMVELNDEQFKKVKAECFKVFE